MNLQWFQSYRGEQFPYYNYKQKNASEVMILNIFAYRLTMFYSCSNNREYIKNGADMISLLKGSKGRNSVKYVGGVTILALCELSVCVLYLYQLS